MARYSKLFGGADEKPKMSKTCIGILVFAVLLIIAGVVIAIFKSSFSEGMCPELTDYECDFRTGCNTKPLTQRSVTNILLDRAQQIEAKRDRAEYDKMMMKRNKEGFDLGLWQPGVSRAVIAGNIVDKKLRTEDIIEGLSGRTCSDQVLQEFGNEGTRINPCANTLMCPARHIVGVPPPPNMKY